MERGLNSHFPSTWACPNLEQSRFKELGYSLHPALPLGRSMDPQQFLDPALSHCHLLSPGIGYFTLPYLVHAAATFAHACEWNDHAVEALRKNLVLNGVQDRCRIHHGDSRQVSCAVWLWTTRPRVASPSPALSSSWSCGMWRTG